MATMPDETRLRNMLRMLDEKPRVDEDFTRGSDVGRNQVTIAAVCGWLMAMRLAGLAKVNSTTQQWMITDRGRARLTEMDAKTYAGKVCGASSRDALTGYGAMMARTETRPGCNDYRAHARKGF